MVPKVLISGPADQACQKWADRPAGSDFRRADGLPGEKPAKGRRQTIQEARMHGVHSACQPCGRAWKADLRSRFLHYGTPTGKWPWIR